MDAKEQTPRGTYTWPTIVIGLLLLHATILMVMVRFALSDPNFILVNDEPPAAAETAPAADAAPTGPVRLQKILASAGVASRRGAEELLRQGRVDVNGRTAQLGESADPTCDRIALDGERLRAEPLRYFVVHKPEGFVTTRSDPERRRTVMELLPPGTPRLSPVGRLDLDTSGLVLLSNDGALAHALLHPSLGNEREYRVSVRGRIAASAIARLERGIHLEDGRTAPARVSGLRYDAGEDLSIFQLTLIEGRKRQIRRSMLALGHPVKRLVRTRIGPLRLGKLERRGARELRPDEVRALLLHAQRLREPGRSQRGRARASRPRRSGPSAHR